MKPSRGYGLAVVVAAASLGGGAGCSLGQGEGRVYSERLFAEDCWNDTYDLQPDFFAASPFRESLEIRVQRGSDITEVSDGLHVLVDDVNAVRTAIQRDGQARFCVTLPVGVAPPGSPVGVPDDEGDGVGGEGGGLPPGLEGLTDCEDRLVHMSLYLQRSCHNQNLVLYAVRGVVTFDHLFSGDPNEQEADQKLTQASFRVFVGNLNDVPLGAAAEDVPADLQSELTGDFSFYFERGQPAQPFP